MKLYYIASSPYARKVRVFAAEAGLADRLTLVNADVWSEPNGVAAINPIGKIPALETGDGQVLADSPLICAWLDRQHDGPSLIPTDPAAHFAALQRQVVADGLIEAVRVRGVELVRRPAGTRWDAWLARQEAAVARLLPVLETEAAALAAGVDIAAIAVGCALSYVDLRYGEHDWRTACPRLAAWHRDFAARPSMTTTAPPV